SSSNFDAPHHSSPTRRSLFGKCSSAVTDHFTCQLGSTKSPYGSSTSSPASCTAPLGGTKYSASQLAPGSVVTVSTSPAKARTSTVGPSDASPADDSIV